MLRYSDNDKIRYLTYVFPTSKNIAFKVMTLFHTKQ